MEKGKEERNKIISSPSCVPGISGHLISFLHFSYQGHIISISEMRHRMLKEVKPVAPGGGVRQWWLIGDENLVL